MSDISIVETRPPDCPVCDASTMYWDADIVLEDGSMARCRVCDHMTPVWAMGAGTDV